MSNDKDTMRDEYPANLIQSGVRGKYAKGYREGTNIVLVDPDLHQLFPDSEAVNRALRAYVMCAALRTSMVRIAMKGMA